MIINRTDSKIIQYLILNDEGTDLSISKAVDFTRTTVWKHMKYLVEIGLVEKSESKYTLVTNYSAIIGDIIKSLNDIFQHFEKDTITDEGILTFLSYIVNHTTLRNGNERSR